MAITFLSGGIRVDEDDVAVFGPHRIWAERGLIHLEDSRDNSYHTYPVRTQLHRIRAISDMLKNSSARDIHSEDQFDQANRLRHLRFVEKMVAIIEKAKIQGMPSDASARSSLRAARPKSVVVPGYGGGL